MKRFQSAFAAPSGFVVAATAGKAAKAGRREGPRTSDMQAPFPTSAKTRMHDVRDRAA